jgi:Arc/MetJ family transcription regulator
MRTTVTLDDDLLSRAQELSGICEPSRLLRQALVALVEGAGGKGARPTARRTRSQRAPAAGHPPPPP